MTVGVAKDGDTVLLNPNYDPTAFKTRIRSKSDWAEWIASEKDLGHVGEVVAPAFMDSGEKPSLKGDLLWPFWIGLPFVGNPGMLDRNYAKADERFTVTGKQYIADTKNKWIYLQLKGDKEVDFMKVGEDLQNDCGIYVVAEAHGIDASAFRSEVE